MQQLCHPAMVRALQNRLMPQAEQADMALRASSPDIVEEDGAFVMRNMQDTR